MKANKIRNKQTPLRIRQKPILRFSPTAWAKLLYFRDKSNNEVGGFGITPADDLLYIQEFVTVKQQVTCVSVRFDDQAVGDFFEEQVDLGRKPEQFARHWIHSHPGDSATPSQTDEETFARVFGKSHWSVMSIVSEEGNVYARLSFHVGPGGQVLIPVQVDYGLPFAGTDVDRWDAEYEAHVKTEVVPGNVCHGEMAGFEFEEHSQRASLIDEFDDMSLDERQLLLDELANRPDLWDQESEVMFL